MERSAQSPAIPVVEPARTRSTQITICVSIVFCGLVAGFLNQAEDFTVGDVIAGLVLFFTIIQHFVVLVMAFRQRRGTYTARQIPMLVPATAKLGVVVTAWIQASIWMVVTIFYLTELRWRHHQSFLATGIEAAITFTIAIMCSRERLETLDRLEGEQSQSIVFLMGDNGEYMVAEGP